MLENRTSTSSFSGGIVMSEKYLTVAEPEQVPSYDPQAMAEGLGLTLLDFLGPLLLELDQRLDKRLIRTFVQAIEAILSFRDRINGLVLSELGSYLDPIGKGGGTKRLSRLLHSPKWTAVIIDRFLWWRASQQVQQWEERGEEGLLIWDSSVWEKPESLKSEGLGPVQSSKAKRLTHVKPGYYTPPGKPICVPGQTLDRLAAGRPEPDARASDAGCGMLVDGTWLA